MSNITDYSLRYFSCDGTYIGDFDVIISLEFGRQKNEAGMAELVLPAVYDLSLFDKDYVLEIWRTNNKTNQKELMGNTCWFLRKIELCMGESGEETLTLTFYDAISLLNRRFIAWYEVQRGFAAGEFPGNYPSAIYDRADVVLDYIVYHNFIETGLFVGMPMLPYTDDPENPNEFDAINLHQLIGAERRGFPIILNNKFFIMRDDRVTARTYTFANETCLSAMQGVVDTAEATENRELWFDLVYTPSQQTSNENPVFGTLEFKVWWDYPGSDHTWPNGDVPLLFGPDYQNIVNACLVLDWENEATQVIATAGSADNSVVGLGNLAPGVTIPSSASYAELSEADRCPFYPIEAHISGNENQNNNLETPGTVNVLDSISSKAYAELRQRRAVHTLTGDILQTDGAFIFIDYEYGDLVTVDWKGLTFDATIKKFMVSVNHAGESITVPFEGTVRQKFMV